MNRTTLGNLLVLAYVVGCAFQAVCLAGHLRGHSLNTFLALAVVYGVVMVTFHLLGLAATLLPREPDNGQPEAQGQKSTFGRDDWRPLVGLNLLTAGIFITYFLALRHLEPAVAVALGCGIGPVLALLIKIDFHLSRLLTPGNRVQAVAAIGILLGVGTLLVNAASGSGARSTWDWAVGTASAVCCGTLMVCFTVFCKRLAMRGWKSRKVLAHRWYVLVAGAILFVPAEAWDRLGEPSVWTALALVSVLGTAIPLYLLQEGLTRTSTVNVSLLVAALPAVTIVFQLLDSSLTFSWATAAGVALITLFCWLGVLGTVAAPKSAGN
ncbi:MAG: EamA family transporter [Gemmataceae bacterium]